MWPLILCVFSHSFSSPRFCSRVSAIVSASLLLALYLTLPPHTWSRSPVLYTPAPLPYVTRNVLLLSHQHCSFLLSFPFLFSLFFPFSLISEQYYTSYFHDGWLRFTVIVEMLFHLIFSRFVSLFRSDILDCRFLYGPHFFPLAFIIAEDGKLLARRFARVMRQKTGITLSTVSLFTAYSVFVFYFSASLNPYKRRPSLQRFSRVK